MRGEQVRTHILKLIEKHWPVYVKEIVRDLNLEVNNSNIKKVSYHIKILEKEEKIRTKRIGRALIAWPVEIEKLRLIYELIKVE
jgi:predicted transcriptional regulator